MSEQVICDGCEVAVPIPKLRRTVLKDLVYEYYWNCTECNHKHISYYTDKKIRRDINRQKKRWQRYRKMGTEESERKLSAQINMEDRLIKKDMDGLKDRM